MDKTIENPSDIVNSQRLLEAANDSARHFRNVYGVYLTVMIYTLVVILSTDQELLFSAGGKQLPLVNINVPIVAFFAVMPWALLVIHFYLLIQARFLARKVRDYTQIIRKRIFKKETGKAHRLLFPVPLAHTFVAGKPQPILYTIIFVSLAIFPLVTLIAAQVKFLPYQSEEESLWITWQHRIVIIIDIFLLWYFWYQIYISKNKNLRIDKLSKKCFYFALVFPFILITLIIIVFVRILDFPGENPSPFKNPNLTKFHNLISGSKITPNRFNLRDSKLVKKEPHPEILDTYSFRNKEGKLVIEPYESEWCKYAEPLDTLSNRNFRRANLSNTKICGTDLTRADLVRANLTRADLTEADFTGANLTRANLTDANLTRANLADTDLRDFTERFFWGVIFTRVFLMKYLTGAERMKADLTEANLTRADLTEANLILADLTEANLTRADLTGAKLWNTDLTGADLKYADLTGANLEDADLTEATLWNTDLTGANLGDADLTGANLKDADLTGANLGDADLTGATLWNADLTEATLWDADLIDVDLTEADLIDADLTGADLFGVSLSQTNFTSATMIRTKIDHSYIWKDPDTEETRFPIGIPKDWEDTLKPDYLCPSTFDLDDYIDFSEYADKKQKLKKDELSRSELRSKLDELKEELQTKLARAIEKECERYTPDEP